MMILYGLPPVYFPIPIQSLIIVVSLLERQV